MSQWDRFLRPIRDFQVSRSQIHDQHLCFCYPTIWMLLKLHQPFPVRLHGVVGVDPAISSARVTDEATSRMILNLDRLCLTLDSGHLTSRWLERNCILVSGMMLNMIPTWILGFSQRVEIVYTWMSTGSDAWHQVDGCHDIFTHGRRRYLGSFGYNMPSSFVEKSAECEWFSELSFDTRHASPNARTASPLSRIVAQVVHALSGICIGNPMSDPDNNCRREPQLASLKHTDLRAPRQPNRPAGLRNPRDPGANGLVASRVVDALLSAGYLARGAVRSTSRSSWMPDLFTSKYGSAKLRRRWDGGRGVGRVEEFVSRLRRKKWEEGVKSLVHTGSAWAAWTPRENAKVVLTEESWNEEAVELVNDDRLGALEKGLACYMATKVKVEKEVWKWVKEMEKERQENGEEKGRGFRVNVVLPDTVLGPIMSPKEQGGSTAGMIRGLWDMGHGKGTEEGNGMLLGILKALKPQWFIDARDCGRLYLAALTMEGVQGERFFGFAGRYSWPKVMEILKGVDEEKGSNDGGKWPEQWEAGWDCCEVPNGRALELLKGMGQNDWIGLEKTVRDGVESFQM
ncbi:putative nad-p-binding protein [Zalerion maritima]|uniref:Nad-p-binding protein n=1 Tax=Zalerion maritima TaxID=339359 RepID=A0AAD5WR34_9PEZI|nr:putative nad-p-binding protein [Zalerion maritima]